GSTLCESLLERGDRVIGLDNFHPFYDPRIKRRNLETLHPYPGFRFVAADLRDPAAMNGLLSSEKVDSVMHLAAMAGVRPSIEDPMLYADVNLTGTMVLLEAMRQAGVMRLAFGSSSSVYGGSKETPFKESQVADRPVSPYAATKRAGEVLCHSYHHLFGMHIYCLRFFTVYGPRQRPEMAIHKFTRKIERGEPLPFFGDGSSRRDYTYVDDIVDGVVRALDRLAGFEIINLGGSNTTSLADLVEMIAARVGKPAILDRKGDQPGDVPITYADVSKAGELLGFCPRVGIEEGLDRFMNWYLEMTSALEGE
ncbi:MAG: GDP-mannose 4,6-dehydratase, partial [Planctomycetota bacterium]